MSDGPWKSLPMRPHWKQVAKQAENEAFSLEELSKALFVALLKEAEELPLDAVWRAVMPNDQGDLFGPDLDRKIKALERDHAGSKLVQKLLNCLRYQKAMGSSGREMAVSAVADTLDEVRSRPLTCCPRTLLQKEPLTHGRCPFPPRLRPRPVRFSALSIWVGTVWFTCFIPQSC